jgi:hypothetical protein
MRTNPDFRFEEACFCALVTEPQSFAAFRIEETIFDIHFEAEPVWSNNGCRQRLA